MTSFLPCMHRCHKWGLRAPDLSPSPVSEAVLSCELGSGWEILPCGFFFFCPLQVLRVVAPPLLPLEKGQHGRAGSCWCLDHSQHPHPFQNPSQIPARTPTGMGTGKGKQLFSKGKESRGVANAGIPQSSSSLASKEQKSRGQGRHPSGSGEMFGGPHHSFYLL